MLWDTIHRWITFVLIWRDTGLWYYISASWIWKASRVWTTEQWSHLWNQEPAWCVLIGSYVLNNEEDGLNALAFGPLISHRGRTWASVLEWEENIWFLDVPSKWRLHTRPFIMVHLMTHFLSEGNPSRQRFRTLRYTSFRISPLKKGKHTLTHFTTNTQTKRLH